MVVCMPCGTTRPSFEGEAETHAGELRAAAPRGSFAVTTHAYFSSAPAADGRRALELMAMCCTPRCWPAAPGEALSSKLEAAQATEIAASTATAASARHRHR